MRTDLKLAILKTFVTCTWFVMNDRIQQFQTKPSISLPIFSNDHIEYNGWWPATRLILRCPSMICVFLLLFFMLFSLFLKRVVLFNLVKLILVVYNLKVIVGQCYFTYCIMFLIYDKHWQKLQSSKVWHSTIIQYSFNSSGRNTTRFF